VKRAEVRGCIACARMMTNLAGQPLASVLAYRRETFSFVVSRGASSIQASTKWSKSIGKGGSSVFRFPANLQSLREILVQGDPLIQGIALVSRVILQE